MQQFILVNLIFFILLVSGCRSDHISPQTDCDTTGVSFQADVVPVLQNHCIKCHNDNDARSGVNLERYSGVKIVADDGRLVKVINHDPDFTNMPFGEEQLPACEIEIITAWVNQGAQNN